MERFCDTIRPLAKPKVHISKNLENPLFRQEHLNVFMTLAATSDSPPNIRCTGLVDDFSLPNPARTSILYFVQTPPDVSPEDVTAHIYQFSKPPECCSRVAY